MNLHLMRWYWKRTNRKINMVIETKVAISKCLHWKPPVLEHFLFLMGPTEASKFISILTRFCFFFHKDSWWVVSCIFNNNCLYPGIGEFWVLFKRDQNYKDNWGYIITTTQICQISVSPPMLRKGHDKMVLMHTTERPLNYPALCVSRWGSDKLYLHPMPNPTQGNLTEK